MKLERTTFLRIAMALVLASSAGTLFAQTLNVIRIPIDSVAAPAVQPEVMPEDIPNIVSSLALVDFGSQTYQTQSIQRTWTLTNRGTTAVNIEGVSAAKPTTFSVDGSDCERVLEAGDSCELYAMFSPKTLGRVESAVVVATAEGQALTTTTLRGTGVQGVASLTGPLRIEPVTAGVASPPVAYALKNTGAGTLGLLSMTVTNPSVFKVESTTCTEQLAPGEQCAINVSATVANELQQTGVLRLTTTGSMQSTNSLQLLALLAPPPVTALLPLSVWMYPPGQYFNISDPLVHDLGTLWQSDVSPRQHTLSVKNRSSTTVPVMTIQAEGSALQLVAGGTSCNKYALSPNYSCYVSTAVSTETAVLGPLSGTLTMTAAGYAPATHTLQGVVRKFPLEFVGTDFPTAVSYNPAIGAQWVPFSVAVRTDGAYAASQVTGWGTDLDVTWLALGKIQEDEAARDSATDACLNVSAPAGTPSAVCRIYFRVYVEPQDVGRMIDGSVNVRGQVTDETGQTTTATIQRDFSLTVTGL